MSQILIIDDDHDVCETIESLGTRLGHQCESAHTLRNGLERLRRSHVDVVFLDIRLPDGNGLDHLHEVKAMPSDPEVIILTGKGDADGAELAIQGGVWDYLLKPSPVKEITLTLGRALKYRDEKRNRNHHVALNLQNVVGRSQAMRSCFDLMAQACKSDSNVLITGETGTGKELFARTIHENSSRASGEFVVVDCASLTENLVESTLFGHKKGAFTGADRDRIGLIKLADQGTLLLDEVGEMPLSLQKAFLRVLQERRFRPVGEAREIQSNFRLISATNRELEDHVRQNRFRSDLFFRLKTVQIRLPSLRERREDIRPLAMHFVERLSRRYDSAIKGFGSEFFSTLEAYDWPGNVRELANVLERAFVAAGAERTLYAMHLPQELRIEVAKAQIVERRHAAMPSVPTVPGEPETPDANVETTAGAVPQPTAATGVNAVLPENQPLPSLKEFKIRAEKKYLETLVARHDSELKDALKVAGLSRSHFYALLKKHDIRH
ncbi:MAG: sigma-54 dependent transcriptional regulator [Desulfovibrio sp.]|jgi:two-component system NtrC family response regulator|nr:sigma-54 dependent transcriptional regulator [Desulfovibrio sp.]